MKVFGLVGWSGSGKTTLMVRLLRELDGRGIAVSTVKHAHHDFDIDKPGKDSYEHRAAGAREVMVTAARRWALMHEHRGEAESTFEEIVARMSPVDLLLIEGFKDHDHEKLEIHRRDAHTPLLAREDPRVVAVASDEPLPDLRVPVLDLDDVDGIADFILDRCGLGAQGCGRGGARGAA